MEGHGTSLGKPEEDGAGESLLTPVQLDQSRSEGFHRGRHLLPLGWKEAVPLTSWRFRVWFRSIESHNIEGIGMTLLKCLPERSQIIGVRSPSVQENQTWHHWGPEL